MEKFTVAEQRKLMNECLQIARFFCPIDTGNMRYNAIKLEYNGNGRWQIWIDGDPANWNTTIAPYFPYTQYPWVNKIWNGKKNPNEGWWDRVQESMAVLLAGKLNGKMTKE